MKQLLIVANNPSPNTQSMAEQTFLGAKSINSIEHDNQSTVNTLLKNPFDTQPQDVLQASAIILGTTENLGYMSGALKDFFDRIYYPCLNKTNGLPFALYIRAGHDGTATQNAISPILTGLKWRQSHPDVICKGAFKPSFLEDCHQLGMYMAASLEAGII